MKKDDDIGGMGEMVVMSESEYEDMKYDLDYYAIIIQMLIHRIDNGINKNCICEDCVNEYIKEMKGGMN